MSINSIYYSAGDRFFLKGQPDYDHNGFLFYLFFIIIFFCNWNKIKVTNKTHLIYYFFVIKN